MADVYVIIVIQSLLLLFLQFSESVLPSNFVARKLCHAGSGFLMLFLDSREIIARVFIYLVVVSSLAMTWLEKMPSFRFGKKHDEGITIYLLIVFFWFFFLRPSEALAPLFFADPAGAVCGKICSAAGINTEWYQNKTIFGSLGVFVFAFASLNVIPTTAERLVVAATCALAEALGGKTYDNAVIAIPALGSYLYYHGW